MKFLADENIPLELVQKLQRENIDIASMSLISPGVSDAEVLEYARKERRVLITLDQDFGQLLFHKRKQSFGVIFIQIHPQSTKEIYQLTKKVFAMKIDFIHSFCVVEKHRIRVITFKEI